MAFAHDYSYPFYHLAFGYLSDRLGHIQGLLGVNGYVVAPEGPHPSGVGYSRREEVFFDWRDCDVPRPTAPEEALTVTRELNEGGGRLPNATFHLCYGANKVGACDTYCVGRFSRAEEAQDTSFVAWLGINDEWQGRGWGRFLLLTALHELRALGYTRSAISTNLTNYRAMTFYANLGYDVVGNGYEFTKSLV
jgi:GNAT superfamily N-acetyltransferase